LGGGLSDAGIQVPQLSSPHFAKLFDGKAADLIAHFRMDLLEHGSRKGLVGTGNRASDSVRRLIPQCDFRALPLQFTIEPIGSGPDLALPQLEHQMAVAPAVETENQLNEARRKQRTQASDLLPKLHQGWGGDMAPGQVEDLVRPVVRMQSDTSAP
jgi:hypothetical protein